MRLAARRIRNERNTLDFLGGRGFYDSGYRIFILETPVCGASKQESQECVKDAGGQEEEARELAADSQIAQIHSCRQVIEKKRPDGVLVISFAFRPACESERKKSEAAYSGDSLSGWSQT